jgi:serine protease Do
VCRWWTTRVHRFSKLRARRWAGWFGACVAAAGIASSSAHAQSNDDALSPGDRALATRTLRFQVARSLVKVEAVNAANGYALGTGVVVAPRTVVTNCHVTREAVRIQLLWGGLRYRVAAQYADARRDLCILHAPNLDVAPVSIAGGAKAPQVNASPPRVGQSIVAAGFIGGQGLQVAEGEIVALHELDGAKVIQSTTAFTSGASGGGLFNQQGELVGILTFRLRGANAHYFSAPARWLSAAALDPSNAVKVAPFAGSAFWQGERAGLPYFLQAAPLEAGGEWQALVKLTERWSTAERGSAEAWLMRGQAYAALQRGDAAVKALRKAVELDPDYEMAWYELGLAYASGCQNDELRKAALALEQLDRPLSARLMQTASTSNTHRGKTYSC